MDLSLPNSHKKATFRAIYSQLALHQAALKACLKPLFNWRKALQRSHDGATLHDFMRSGPRNLERLHHQLRQGTFHFREGVKLDYNLNGRHRSIYLFPWEERMVDLLLYQGLNRYFDQAFSRNSYAYRHRGQGLDVCQRNIARVISRGPRPLWFLKRDVANFFPSIDHARLREILAHWVEPDDYLYDLVLERIQFRYREGHTELRAEQGVPFGTAMACLLANLYLTPLDRSLEQVPELSYFRYADDFLMCSPSATAIHQARTCFDKGLKELRLTSKKRHHLDFQFSGSEAGQGIRQDPDPVPAVPQFRHLGLAFREDGSVGLSRDKVRKICNLFRFAFRRRRRRLQRAANWEERAVEATRIAKDLVEQGFRSVAIIDYYLKHVDDEAQLARLDRWLAEEILVIAFRKGHRKGHFRKLPFSRLRAMGLPSLVHRRRLLRHGHVVSSFFTLRTERLIEQQRRRLSPRRKPDGIRLRGTGAPGGVSSGSKSSGPGDLGPPVGKGAACG